MLTVKEMYNVNVVNGSEMLMGYRVFNSVLKFCMLGKISADAILKYFSYFSQEVGFNISYCLLEIQQ